MSEVPWRWWAGSHGDIECENIYELGDFATREDAIAAAVEANLGSEDTRTDDEHPLFYVIEAQLADADPAIADWVPFLASRNKSLFAIVDGQAVPA